MAGGGIESHYCNGSLLVSKTSGRGSIPRWLKDDMMTWPYDRYGEHDSGKRPDVLLMTQENAAFLAWVRAIIEYEKQGKPESAAVDGRENE